jgi:hypothetical protein
MEISVSMKTGTSMRCSVSYTDVVYNVDVRDDEWQNVLSHLEQNYPGLPLWSNSNKFTRLRYSEETRGDLVLKNLNEMFENLCQFDVVCNDRDFRGMLNVNETLEGVTEGPPGTKTVSLLRLADKE